MARTWRSSGSPDSVICRVRSRIGSSARAPRSTMPMIAAASGRRARVAAGMRLTGRLGKRTSNAPTGLRPTIIGKTTVVSAASGVAKPLAGRRHLAGLERARMCGYCASGRRTRPVSVSSLSATM